MRCVSRNIATKIIIQRPMVRIEDAKLFVKNVMASVGTKSEHSNALADVLILADQRGIFSHGLNRLGKYVDEVKRGFAQSMSEPYIVKETVSTALINGNSCLGVVVGNYAMQVAIQKAVNTGVGWVAANNSNHFGIAGMYSMQASEKGLLGFCFTNTSPFLVPTRSYERALGTNPISMAAPSANPTDPFVLDMATTAMAQGKVEVAQRKEVPVPPGWGTDRHGQVSLDPTEILTEGGLSPLGGAEITGGYKGYGLAMMVEILCGILSGSAYGRNIRTWNTLEGAANLGQCFIAVDPAVFAPGFSDRLSDLMATCRNLKTVGTEPVLVPGDPERMDVDSCSERGGILYHPNIIHYLDNVADACKVERIRWKEI